MYALLITIILSLGFFTCHTNKNIYFRFNRTQNQYLYSLTGILYLLPSLFALSILFFVNTKYFYIITKNEVLLLLSLSMPSIILCFIFNVIFNDKDENSKITLMYNLLKDSPLDLILFRSYTDLEPLMLSMKDKKVYIGIILDLGEPSEAKSIAQDISIFPIISGYRDKDTLKVKLTTNYQAINDNISLVLKQADINSATFFDFDAYQRFQETENSENNQNNPPATINVISPINTNIDNINQ